MGRRHRRNRRAPLDEVDLSPPNPLFQRRSPPIYTPPLRPTALPLTSIESASKYGAENPFPRRRQRPQQNRPKVPWQQCNEQSCYLLSELQNRHVFLQKSLQLKQNLLRAFTQALQQIEQWLPDENYADGDLMDWQPEAEFLIPQRENIVYTYGMESVQKERMGCARDETTDSQLGYLPSGRHRAASDTGVYAL